MNPEAASPFAIASLAAAGATPVADPAATALHAQLDEDWRYWMQQHPEMATQFGEPGDHGRWTEYSPAAIDARAAYLRQSAARLASLDPTRLAAADRLHYELYRDLLDTAVEGLAFGNDAVPIRGVIPHSLRLPMNQLEGLAQDVPITIALMPAATVGDYERLVQRLEGVPACVEQTIALLTAGLASGITPPAVALHALPDQIGDQIVTDATASPLLQAWTAFPAAIGDADRERLTRAAVAAYSERVRPAFVALRAFLVDRYLPSCRDSVGIDALPDGAAWYAFNVRWHTTLDLSPAEIHEIGRQEVARIRRDMDRVIAGTGFTGTFADFTGFLRSDPRFRHRDAAALLAAYRDLAKRADPQLAPLFGRLPQTPYGVLPVPDALAPSQTTAYYQPGSLGAGRSAHMFVNTWRLEARPTWEMEALTLHEAVPGHHVQIALAQERAGLPAFRRNSSYTAFVEGWALYAESLGGEMGFYVDPYARFGQLTYEMWRAVRLVVDTGLHAMGWSRQQAIEFFAANTPKSETDIAVEVDRYIVWPGQALGYKMGELRLRALRTEAERALGPAFDLRAFHDLVLSEGALPVAVLEARVRDWVARRRGDAARA